MIFADPCSTKCISTPHTNVSTKPSPGIPGLSDYMASRWCSSKPDMLLPLRRISSKYFQAYLNVLSPQFFRFLNARKFPFLMVIMAYKFKPYWQSYIFVYIFVLCAPRHGKIKGAMETVGSQGSLASLLPLSLPSISPKPPTSPWNHFQSLNIKYLDIKYFNEHVLSSIHDFWANILK